ncbi:hypothetical protein MPL3356_120131 [Mesorhizobium plurifarium]|uniref:Uncharacterized protein n=1 Tax=Mesorhizobium plurifarium TaxID=69974 RepID=A0A090DBI8_MESPL|nr:hypothetical protein MPL3356_120131 [Mesorhizobium plurifarium]
MIGKQRFRAGALEQPLDAYADQGRQVEAGRGRRDVHAEIEGRLFRFARRDEGTSARRRVDQVSAPGFGKRPRHGRKIHPEQPGKFPLRRQPVARLQTTVRAGIRKSVDDLEINGSWPRRQSREPAEVTFAGHLSLSIHFVALYAYKNDICMYP